MQFTVDQIITISMLEKNLSDILISYVFQKVNLTSISSSAVWTTVGAKVYADKILACERSDYAEIINTANLLLTIK